MNKLYLCQDGAFLVVPTVMQPPLDATKTYGPLAFAGYVKLRSLDPATFARVCAELDDRNFSRLTHTEMPAETRISGAVQDGSGTDITLVDDLAQGFRTTVAALCACSDGLQCADAVNREYEAILSVTPLDLMDVVHERLVATMREHGLVQASRPPYF